MRLSLFRLRLYEKRYFYVQTCSRLFKREGLEGDFIVSNCTIIK